MKTKKIALVLITILALLQGVVAQKNLSKSTINDFAAACWYNYRFGNMNFVATMNTYLPYERSKVAEVMENLDTDVKGREEVFKLFYRVSSGNYEAIFRYLYGLPLPASASKEIATYIVAKYDKPAVTSGMFSGTKKFSDGEAWDYLVTISGNHITLKSYPNIRNSYYKDKTKPKEIITGYIKDGNIITKKYQYKIEDGVLYKENNEGGWNDYYEVTK